MEGEREREREREREAGRREKMIDEELELPIKNYPPELHMNSES